MPSSETTPCFRAREVAFTSCLPNLSTSSTRAGTSRRRASPGAPRRPRCTTPPRPVCPSRASSRPPKTSRCWAGGTPTTTSTTCGASHLPKTDLSGLKLEFDIEYDQALDGAMRFDAAKYPSVSWDAMTFVTGKGDVHEVRLLDHATVVSGSETPASVADRHRTATSHARRDRLSPPLLPRHPLHGGEHRLPRRNPTDRRCEPARTSAQSAERSAGRRRLRLRGGRQLWIERTGTNEEQTSVSSVSVLLGSIRARVTHEAPGRTVTSRARPWRGTWRRSSPSVINTAGDDGARPVRPGPEQSVIASHFDGRSCSCGRRLAAVHAGAAAGRALREARQPGPRAGHAGRTLTGVPVDQQARLVRLAADCASFSAATTTRSTTSPSTSRRAPRQATTSWCR